MSGGSVAYLGLDMGAATSRLARMEPEKRMPTVVRNTLSNEATGTVVYFPATADAARGYGENAGPKAVSKPDETVTDMLDWLLGSTEESTAGETGFRCIGERRLHAVQVVGFYLKSLLQLGCPKEFSATPESRAVWMGTSVRLCACVSPCASPSARTALRQACVLAGIPAAHLLITSADEAAALYFHHHQHRSLCEREAAGETPAAVVIVDVGAASSFATLLAVTTTTVEKVATAARQMGTGVMDEALVEFVLSDMERRHGAAAATLRGDLKVRRKLLVECRKAKEILSTTDETRIQIDFIKNDLDVNMTVSRALLEQHAAPFLLELTEMLRGLREKAAGYGSELRVEVIGGGWRCPCVIEVLKNALGVERLGTALDANLAVAEGSAILSLLALHTEGDAAALERPPHQVETAGLDFAVSAGVPLDSAAAQAVAGFGAAEEAMAATDEAVQLHLAALNQLDSLVLQTLAVLDRCDMDPARREALTSYLIQCDDYVRDEGEEASTADLEAKREAVQQHLASEFPEIDAYYAQRRLEEAEKEAALTRLSKEKKEEEDDPKSDPQRLRLAQKRREQGAALFKQECWAEAQTRFVQALSALGQLYDTSSEENASKKAEISLSCHLNIASCSVRLGIWRNAINNCTAALEISPGNAKAHFRRGQAYMGLREYAEAIKDLEKASALSHQDAMVQVELGKARQAYEVQKAKEKKMYAKMFG
eukprot:gene3614-2552_t